MRASGDLRLTGNKVKAEQRFQISATQFRLVQRFVDKHKDGKFVRAEHFLLQIAEDYKSDELEGEADR